MRSILEYLERTAGCRTLETGVEDEKGFISWPEVMNTSKRIGTAISRKVCLGMPVAVLMEKSAEAVTAMFGAVYAGCYYSVIDPRQPKERIREIFRVLDPAIVLLESSQYEALMDEIAFTGPRLQLQTAAAEEADEKRLTQIRRMCRDSDILYCMFTSGSTGIPKGILVTHRAVRDFLIHFTGLFEISWRDRIGNQAPFDFDVSVKDIYSGVMTGASLVLIPERMFTMPPILLEYLSNRKVTTLIWAVSALTLLSSLKGLQYRIPREIRRILFSGEAMPAKQLRIWQEALPEAEFVNLYGPTEITCNCTYFRVRRKYEDWERIPAGRPFPGREIFLLGDDDETVSEINKVGEICVAGESLSNGYCHLPEETKKHFQQKPDGETFYRTGDLGYLGEDAELYVVGRKDDQVKIMGRRVEPGEVEHLMNQIEGVQKSCCLANASHTALAAFFTGDADTEAIHNWLKERLPRQMVPRRIIRLSELPLNKHGKTDRQRLREIMEGRPC